MKELLYVFVKDNGPLSLPRNLIINSRHTHQLQTCDNAQFLHTTVTQISYIETESLPFCNESEI